MMMNGQAIDDNDPQGPFATMDVELWALIFNHVDRLSLPVVFFVSRRLRDAVRHRRLVGVGPINAECDVRGNDARLQLPIYAVHYDYVASLIEARRPAVARWAVDEIGCATPPGVCRMIAATGDLDLLKWARLDKGRLWDTHVFCAAVMSGCLDMVEWLADNDCPWSADRIIQDVHVYKRTTEEMLLWLFKACDRHGRVHLPARTALAINSVDDVDTECYDDNNPSSAIVTALITAARAGHIGALDWLWRRYPADGYHDLPSRTLGLDIVSYTGEIKDAVVRRHTIQWLVGHGWTYTPGTLARLADCGDLETLMWLWARRGADHTGQVWSSLLYQRAAAHGHMRVIEWLDAVGVPWDVRTCTDAAGGGHLTVIKWAKAKGHPWRDNICDQASRRSRLDVLAWAYEKHGCPWSERAKRKACTWAAKNNHFEAMRWAFARGSSLGEKAVIYAVFHGRVDMLDWIDAHATIDWPLHRFLCGEALLSGHIEAIAWLRKRGVPWDYWQAMRCDTPAGMRHAIVDHGCPMESTMCADAATEGDLEMLMWLRARGCPWDARVCDSAARGGHLAVLRWARAQGCPWTCGVEHEAQDTDPEVLEWLGQQEDRPQPASDGDALNTLILQFIADTSMTNDAVRQRW